MANRNVACAVRLALIAAGTASAAMYAPGALAQDAELEQVVVTGSRIARPEVETASPIAVLGSEEIALSGTQNLEKILNIMPQVVATSTDASNNPGGGVATVNLRNLGSQRTLVLVDGRRYVSYDVNQIVDLNTVPASLVERIDVVTGGRSAVYGSDAIAGVVNFVMKDNFEGVEFNTAYKTSGRGDGTAYGGDMTIGGNFAEGKGNAVMFASYFNRDGVLAGARPFTRVAYSDLGDGTMAPGGSGGIPALRGTIPGGVGAKKFDQNGNLTPYVTPRDLYNFAPENYIQVPQERYLIYGMAHYDVTDWFKPYVEGQFINNKVPQQLAPTPIGNTTPGVSSRGGLQIHTYSPFLSPSAQATLQGVDTNKDGYVPIGAWGRRMSEMGPRIVNDDRNAFRVLFGTEGDFATDWNYDLFYMYAQTQNSQTQEGNIAISRFMAATRTGFMNAAGQVQVLPWNQAGLPNNGAGTLVCADAGARDSGCVPLNIYGPNNASAEAVDYISVGTINQEKASTQMASLVFSNGNLADFWGAGAIGVAVGAEYRREAGQNQTDEYLASGDVAGFNPASPTKGSYAVTEYFGEVNVPIVRDLFLAKTVDVNAAYRYSDYSNAVGGVSTWSAGLQWELIQGFTLRGQYQRAIRGPSVAELYLGQTVDFSGAIDPCLQPSAATDPELKALCVATGVPANAVGTNYGSGSTSYPAVQGGNPDLTEESSDTWTAGFVWQPTFIDNFLLTVDWYSISIEDVITSGVGAQNLVDACFDYGQTEYCKLITRASTGEFEQFYDTNVNAANLDTSGIDVNASYSLAMGDYGNLGFDLWGTWVEKNDYTPIAGLPIINECAGAFGRNCGAPDPEWRHSFRTTWSMGPATVSLLWQYLDGVTDDDPTYVYATEELDNKSYFDLSGTWVFNDSVTLGLGIDNLFNTDPGTFIPSTQQGGNGQQSNTYPSVYDVMGRMYWATLQVKF